jgi:hypothetical protein
MSENGIRVASGLPSHNMDWTALLSGFEQSVASCAFNSLRNNKFLYFVDKLPSLSRYISLAD